MIMNPAAMRRTGGANGPGGVKDWWGGWADEVKGLARWGVSKWQERLGRQELLGWRGVLEWREVLGWQGWLGWRRCRLRGAGRG